jgi:FKBP-type peptidyl-prolyl cis-trans isomerase
MLLRGDSATLVVDAAKFYTTTANLTELPEFVNEGDDLVFDVKINAVQSEEEVQAAEQLRMEQRKADEQGLIDQYVTDNEITGTPSESGIYFMEIEKGKGRTPEKDDWLSVHYTVHTLEGERLFSTHDRGAPIDFQLGKRFENEGFQEVVGMMREEGVAEALVPSSMAFGAQGAGQVIQPFTPLFYKVELMDIMTMDEWEKKQADEKAKQMADKLAKQGEEKGVIQKYIAENNLTPTDQTAEGLVYVEEVKGDGPKPERGDKVKVHYTGKTLDGNVFDSSVERGTPFEFIVGRNMVIKGWDEGIPMMNVGSKGLLIIPFDMAYGERGAGDRIPPFSTLVFEVELLEITEEAQE